MGLLLFYGGLNTSFLFDDHTKIRDNPDLHLSSFSLDNFIHDYSQKTTTYRNDPSRPLTFVLYWFLWQIGDGDVFPFHLTSLFLHLLCSIGVGWLCHSLLRKQNQQKTFVPVVISSFYFLSLPLNAGSVIYVYAMSDLLAAFFSLILLILASRRPLDRWPEILISLLIYEAAVLSKQSALILPLLLVAFDFLLSGWSQVKRRRRWHLTLWAMAGAYLLWRELFFGRIGDLEAYETFRVSIYAPLQGIMIWKYAAWIWNPSGLSIDHAITPSMFEYWQCSLAWIALLSVTAGLFWWARRTSLGRITACCWLLFLLPLLPTSSFFPTTDLLVERRAYLSAAGILIGFALIAQELLFRLRGKRGAKALASLFLLMGLGWDMWVSLERVHLYENEDLLWIESKSLYPRNERARVNLVTFYLSRENFQKADEESQALLEMYPEYPLALVNRGAYFQHPRNPRRDLQKALDIYQKVLAQDPQDLTAWTNQGNLLLELKRPQEAVRSFEKILGLTSNSIEARLGLAKAALRLGQFDSARNQAQYVLQLQPQNQEAQRLLRQIP